MNVLLISEDTLRTNSNLNENCFGKWILPAIREAQEMGLMPLIGECLYNKICELVEDGTIGEIEFIQYKDLLDDYIQPYLIYQTLTNIVPILNGKLGNIGTVNTTDEHIVSLSQGEQDLLQNYYRERAEFYQNRLAGWVKTHADSFPELSCFCGMEQPHLDRNTNSVGLWLGGMRGRKLAKPCGCGGTTSGGGGGGGSYQQGYQDGLREGIIQGRTAQKALLSSTTITTNGDFERANGWSAVTVQVQASGTVQPQRNETITAETQTILPLAGYDAMAEVVTDASGFARDNYDSGYTKGYENGAKDSLEGINWIDGPLPETLSITDKGVYAFVYDGTQQGSSMCIDFASTPVTGYSGFVRIEVNDTLSGTPLYNLTADTSTLGDVIIDGNIYTGNTYTGYIGRIEFCFDGIIPDEFFKDLQYGYGSRVEIHTSTMIIGERAFLRAPFYNIMLITDYTTTIKREAFSNMPNLVIMSFFAWMYGQSKYVVEDWGIAYNSNLSSLQFGGYYPSDYTLFSATQTCFYGSKEGGVATVWNTTYDPTFSSFWFNTLEPKGWTKRNL